MSKAKILALWSTPRSRSTAFLWMMRQRGDLVVQHEPFGRAAYYSEERVFDRAAETPPQAVYNYENVLQTLRAKASASRLFIKDFPYYFPHLLAQEAFLESFQHTFLIRHPAETLPSYYYKMPDLTFEECGYKELFLLFERVAERSGARPMMIHADDLVERAAETAQAYCAAVSLPYMAEALNWQPPCNSTEFGWWGDGSWTDDLRLSAGFQTVEKPNYPSIDEDEALGVLYERCLPYYEKLNQHCWRAN